jgi:hypothetical protein
MIVIDEADRLKFLTLEQVRDIYDRTSTAILIGMPGLEKRLACYPQLLLYVTRIHRRLFSVSAPHGVEVVGTDAKMG